MDLCQSSRFPIHCPIAFSGVQTDGQGRLSNLSMEGCKIGSSTILHRGSYLELAIHCAAPASPIKVGLASVRWSKEREFGVKFIHILPDERARLRRFVSALERDQSLTSEAGGFPKNFGPHTDHQTRMNLMEVKT